MAMSAEDVTLKKDFSKDKITQAFSDHLKELSAKVSAAIALITKDNTMTVTVPIKNALLDADVAAVAMATTASLGDNGVAWRTAVSKKA